ncbi:hypothetical protein ISF6_0964 [Piscinibacter sakaiensis]|uniref:Uncharacterized protein n=1 Tax=Piscinibacter sakaiensis TaxID=1547922 RepID=A0A0K8NYA9_PISS1|nr:hypothetical protein ISF6_0964 [Piscinibacter sakaiensis]
MGRGGVLDAARTRAPGRSPLSHSRGAVRTRATRHSAGPRRRPGPSMAR